MRSFNDLSDLEKKAFELFSRGKKIAVVSNCCCFKGIEDSLLKSSKTKVKVSLVGSIQRALRWLG